MKKNSEMTLTGLDDPFVVSFLEGRVQLTELLRPVSTYARRDKYEQALPLLTDVMHGLGESTYQQKVNDTLQFFHDLRGNLPNIPEHLDPSEVMARKAQRLYPAATKELGIEGKLDLYLLNRRRRLTWLNRLSDGSYTYAAQRQLDRSFYLLHDLLFFYRFADHGSGKVLFRDPKSFAPTTEASPAKIYRIFFAEQLLQFHLDAWDLLSSRMIADNLPHYLTGQEGAYETSELGATLAALAMKEQVAGDATAAEALLNQAKLLIGRSPSNFVMTTLGKAERAILGSASGSRIVLNHPLQVKNAYRAGAIPEKRFLKESSKHEAIQEQEEIRQKELLNLLEKQPFLAALPSDPPKPSLPADFMDTQSAHIFAELDAISFETTDLDTEQLHDYYRAFGLQTILPLFRLYTPFRLTSLLRSLVHFPDLIDMARVDGELKILAAHQSEPFLAPELATFLNSLAKQTPEERQDRLELLKAFELKPVRVYAPSVYSNEERALRKSTKELDEEIKRLGLAVKANEDDGATLGNAKNDGPFTDFFVGGDEDSLNIAQLPLDVLRRALKKGRIVRPFNRHELIERRTGGYDKAWSHDLKLLKSLEEDKSALFTAQRDLKGDPKRFAHMLEVFCEKLLDLGKGMTYVGELQLGYWVDALTVALVRAKQEKDAAVWLERYFSLPVEYQERLSNSDRTSMLKRLESCKARSL